MKTHPPDPLERPQTTTDETVVVMTPPKVYPPDPSERPRTTTVRPVRPLPATALMPDKLVMTLGNGGWIDEHRMLFEGYRRSGTRVELRGPCYSACTMITAYVAKDKLCIAPGTFLAFHAARAGEGNSQQIVPETTAQMYRMQPPEIRNWIDHNGGHDKLPLHGFWTMYDRELWAMGYPQCRLSIINTGEADGGLVFPALLDHPYDAGRRLRPVYSAMILEVALWSPPALA